VKIIKSLYGLKESARLWHLHVSERLRSLGYLQLEYDECVFRKDSTYIALYVDDLLIVTSDEMERKRVVAGLESRYGKLKTTEGAELIYRGLQISIQEDKSIRVHQTQYTKKLIAEEKIQGYTNTPSTAKLFDIDMSAKQIDPVSFTRCSKKIAWIATQCRPDLRLVSSFLCSREMCPTVEDNAKLRHALRYLNFTSGLGLRFEYGQELILKTYADASHLLTTDCRAQSGILVKLGSGTIAAESRKQNLVAQSSTEAELVSLNQGVNLTMWCRMFLVELMNKKIPSTEVFQDNQSCIALAEGGRPTLRTRHISMRYFHVTDMMKKGEIQLTFIPTDKMIADVLTKTVDKATFHQMRGVLLNDITPEDTNQGC
jgi:hypothetical protein